MRSLMSQNGLIQFYLKHKTNAQLEEVGPLKIITYDANVRGEMKPALCIFIGKSSKEYDNYYYNKLEDRNNKINARIKSEYDWMKRKEENRKSKKDFQHTLKVGDILYSSWGYEQTNIDFYQVIDVKGKTIKIRSIKGKNVSTDTYCSGKCIALKDQFTNDEILTKRVGIGNSVRITSYANATLWDGKPCYYSWGY